MLAPASPSAPRGEGKPEGKPLVDPAQSSGFQGALDRFFYYVAVVWPPLETSDTPPEEATSFSLHEGESVMYYQRSQYPMGLTKLESEVVVTQRRIILTETKMLQGPFPLVLRMQQRALDKTLVKGYEAGILLPKLRWFLFYLLVVAAALFFLNEGPKAAFEALMQVRVFPLIRMFGGPCRGFGNCDQAAAGSNASSLLQQPPFMGKPRRDARPDPPSNVVLEVLASSAARSYRAHPRRHRGQTLRGDAALVQGAGTDASVAARRGVEDRGATYCTDFPSWQDFDGNSCARYAEGNWAFSCVQEDVLTNTDRFASRRDTTSLELTVLEACCICGGGEHTARALAVDRLVAVLWPIVEAVGAAAAAPPGNMPKVTKGLLKLAALKGQDALKLRLANLTSEQLLLLGHLTMGLPVEQIIMGEAPLPAALSKLLVGLAAADANATDTGDPGNATQMAMGAEAPGPSLSGKEFLTELHDAKLEVLAKASTGYRMLLCLWRVLWVLVLLYGLLSTYGWVAQRYSNQRVYVLLRFNSDYFGEGREVGDDYPLRLFASGAHKFSAFLLPCPRLHPHRLAEFAATLAKNSEKGELAAQIGAA